MTFGDHDSVPREDSQAADSREQAILRRFHRMPIAGLTVHRDGRGPDGRSLKVWGNMEAVSHVMSHALVSSGTDLLVLMAIAHQGDAPGAVGTSACARSPRARLQRGLAPTGVSVWRSRQNPANR